MINLKIFQKCTIALKTALIVSLFLCGFSTAQEDRPGIAVYVTGDNIPNTTKDALGAFLLDALVNSGRYRTIERSESFLLEVTKEHIKQRSGAIDDEQISRLGKQAGARFLCVANITEALGASQVSARVIDVETAEVTASGVSDSPLKTLDELKRVSAAVVYKMIGVRVKTDQNFELLTDNEQTALEQSIQQSIQQTVRETMQSKKPLKTSFWAALGFDIAGAGMLIYGISEEFNVKNHNDRGNYKEAKKSTDNRNLGYIAGGAALLTGISIHIFF